MLLGGRKRKKIIVLHLVDSKGLCFAFLFIFKFFYKEYSPKMFPFLYCFFIVVKYTQHKIHYLTTFRCIIQFHLSTFTILCNHQYYPFLELFHYPKCNLFKKQEMILTGRMGNLNLHGVPVCIPLGVSVYQFSSGLNVFIT